MSDTFFQNLGNLNNTAQSTSETVLIRTLTTCLQMLQDRNYTSLQVCQTVDEIKQHMFEGKHVLTGTASDEKILVFFHNEERVGVKQLRTWTEKNGNDKLIIVSLDGPTAFTRKDV